MKKTDLRTNLGAAAIMVLGCAAVMALVVAINGISTAHLPEEVSPKSSFAVVAPPPPKPRERARQKARPKKPATEARATRPSVLSSIAGPSFGIDALEHKGALDGAEGILSRARDLVMTEDAVDELPSPKTRNAPSYPERARARGVEGYVVLNLLINASGEVETIRVLEASPSGVFEQAATSAVRDWKFSPATYKQEAVKVWAKQTVRFNLS